MCHDFAKKIIHTKGMISFKPLWKTLKAKRITQYQLIEMGIDRRTMNWLRQNKNVTVLTIDKLCTLLKCTPNDVLEILPDEESES